jgi:hypothetical protein
METQEGRSRQEYPAENQLKGIKQGDFVIVKRGKETSFGFYSATNYDAQKNGWISLQNQSSPLFSFNRAIFGWKDPAPNLAKPIPIDSGTVVQKIESGTEARLTLDAKTLQANQIKGNPVEAKVSFAKDGGKPVITFDYNGKKIGVSVENVEKFEVVEPKKEETEGFIKK